MAAFARWVQDKRQKLDALLVLSGAMDDATCRALWVIVEKMIHDQGGSIIDSLARLKSHELSESRAALEALDDADIRKSCVLLPVFETLYPSAVPAGRWCIRTLPSSPTAPRRTRRHGARADRA